MHNLQVAAVKADSDDLSRYRLPVQARERGNKIRTIPCKPARDRDIMPVSMAETTNKLAAVYLAPVGYDHRITKTGTFRQFIHQGKPCLLAGGISRDSYRC